MKKEFLILLILTIASNIFGQSIQLSDQLSLIQLTDRTYMHTCQNNNGLVFINGKEALIVSTPDSDSETQNLIDWVKNEKGVKIVGYVIDRWHPDAMEGLDVVHKNGIKSYAYKLTQQIAKEKGLPVPQTGFDPKTEIPVGNEKVVCHYLGQAHTKDGIVVWIPSEQILFGGNEIRNFNGWNGNIGDASLDQWSETATNVKQEYGSAKIVVPGHGDYGGAELIDYTILLYEPFKRDSSENMTETTLEPLFKTNEDFCVIAESDSIQNRTRILQNATVIVQDSTKYVKIESPQIFFQPDKKRIDSDQGKLKIYDKTTDGEQLRTAVSYSGLIVFKEDDSVGLRVVVKELRK